MRELDTVDRQIIDKLQGEFPICSRPYADVAERLGISEDDLLKGDGQGFLTVTHHRGDEHVPVTLFCILPDRLGEISDFTFDEPEKLKIMLDLMFETV